MNNENKMNDANKESAFIRQVAAQAARKLKARRGPARSLWYGLGMSGLIGWSVMIPTLIGAAVGIWVDARYPSSYSWTLMLMLLGLIIGCFNAWHWVDSESKEMQEDLDE